MRSTGGQWARRRLKELKKTIKIMKKENRQRKKLFEDKRQSVPLCPTMGHEKQFRRLRILRNECREGMQRDSKKEKTG